MKPHRTIAGYAAIQKGNKGKMLKKKMRELLLIFFLSFIAS
jgi:hypothetical protein